MNPDQIVGGGFMFLPPTPRPRNRHHALRGGGQGPGAHHHGLPSSRGRQQRPPRPRSHGGLGRSNANNNNNNPLPPHPHHHLHYQPHHHNHGYGVNMIFNNEVWPKDEDESESDLSSELMGLRLSGSGGEPGRDWNGRIGNLLSWSRSSAVSFGPAPSKEPQAAAASSSSSPSSSNTLNSILSEQNRCRQNELGNLGDELADVTFRVQEDQGEASLSKNEVSFKAHKFLLALRSPVFKAMFYGPLAEQSSEILVPDVTPTAFKSMLNYIYKDEVMLLQSLQGAWQLWYAAKKYMLDGLEEKCRKHLKTHMTPLNVLDTFAFAENYGDTQVLYQCLRLIDRNARYIFASPGFSALPINLVKALIGRNTLNAKEIDIFDSVIRWSQAEIKRRLDDGDEGTVPSLNELFAEFLPYIRCSGFTSQEFVHTVLPHGVLDLQTISNVASKIRHTEEPESFQDAPKGSTGSSLAAPESRCLGLNHARDLLLFEAIGLGSSGQAVPAGGSSNSSSAQSGQLLPPSSHAGSAGKAGLKLSQAESLRNGNVHSKEATEDDQVRYGPGYYQCTRFCHMSRLMIANSWPTEYTLKFKADKDIYLLGACVTETDRQFYSPKLKYVLKLKDSAGNIMSDGSETFIKKTSNKIEGGLPKALDYGPHDITFKSPSHINKNLWYELSLSISNVEAPWNKYPLIVCKCKDDLVSFGVEFQFEKSYEFKEEDRAMFDIEEDDAAVLATTSSDSSDDNEDEEDDEDDDIEGAVGGRIPAELRREGSNSSKSKERTKKKSKDKRNIDDDGLTYGLISRLYFYY